MIQCRAPAKRLSAIGALVVPRKVDLIARRLAGDQLRFFNPVFHRPGQATGKRKRQGPQCRHR